jgi:serine/threonine protein kinase
MLSLEGKQLGNYDVIRRIRVGGMGAVYEGRQRTAFDRRVAIKVILGDYATDPEMRRRFEREARIVARLHHPNILPLIEFGMEKNILYLVMPFIDGGTLTNYLRRNTPDLDEISAIYQQLLDAVEYAHDEGLIHRDIKSSNVLLEQHRNGPPHVYLADFGLVRTARQAEQEQAGKPIPLDQVPGTPHYMAPEQTRGIITPLTDIYALGVLLYQMLTGELPYNDGDDIKVIQMHLYAPIPSLCDRDVSIPRELDEVTRTAMAKRPEARYQNITQLRAAFLAAVKGPSIMGLDDDRTPELDYRPPPVRKRTSVSLASEDAQELEVLPVAIPRHLRNLSPTPIVVGERKRQHITGEARQQQRITEEPVKLKHKPFQPWYAMMIVPLILLVLLLMPRMLGISFFPTGFPIFGTPPVALVYVTAQTKDFQDTYVLTASPQVKEPDLSTHTIPDRIVQRTLTDTRTVQTTGTKTIDGTQAHGTVLFVNHGNDAVSFSAQFTLTTAQGIQIQLTQGVIVPPRTNGQNGTAIALAVAVEQGAAGNIPAHALDGTCCTNGVSISNPAAFTGGTDAQTVHVVIQADLDNARKASLAALQSQVMPQLQKQLGSQEVLAGQPASTVSVSSDSPVGTQAEQVQVVTTLAITATVYNTAVADHIALQLLSQAAAHTLGNAYQPQGAPTVTSRRIVNQEHNGLIFLDVSAHGVWIYTFTKQQIEQWRHSIKGATTEAALAYLNAQTGVEAVQIHLPFGADHFPISVDEIKIVPVSPQS